MAGTACQTGEPLNQLAFDMLKAESVYQSELTQDPKAAMSAVCRGAALCPRFTTCVVYAAAFDPRGTPSQICRFPQDRERACTGVL